MDWPLTDGQRVEAGGTEATGTTGTTITASGSADTKGSYTQLIASTSFTAAVLYVVGGRSDQANGADFLVDIAIGAGGSEQIIAENLLITETAAFSPHFFILPIMIPGGSRLAAKCQSSIGGAAIRIHVMLVGQSLKPSGPFTKVTTYGANTADSGGTSIDPGASADTKGAWFQITAATTHPINALCLSFGAQGNNVRTTARWLVDIAIGAGGSEQVVIPDVMIFTTVVGDQILPCVVNFPYGVSIPEGSRIAARAACSITDATDRLIDLEIVGTGGD